MAYFVTGATGFIGRYLVQELVDNREGEIFVLCREGSLGRLDALIEEWDTDRVTPVVGDLGEPDLGLSPQWITAHRDDVEHFFHLAAIYDMTASDEMNEELNVGGTRAALSLAGAVNAGVFHQVSSIAAVESSAGPSSKRSSSLTSASRAARDVPGPSERAASRSASSAR